MNETSEQSDNQCKGISEIVYSLHYVDIMIAISFYFHFFCNCFISNHNNVNKFEIVLNFDYDVCFMNSFVNQNKSKSSGIINIDLEYH